MSNNKEDNFKEQFKQALISTAKVISEDYTLDIKKTDKNLTSKKIDFFDLTNLSNKKDFIRLRAETDSSALKKKFSNKEIFNKNLPNNPSYKNLYNIAEKIRYEILGGKMLKGVERNLSENYEQKINLVRKDQLKTKEDVPVTEAFELYMLKKFFNLKLNTISSKMLSFWEKDFNSSIDMHLDFLNKNLEDQNNYSLKFLEIFENMNVFNSNNDERNKDDKEKDNEQENKSEKNDDQQLDNKEDANKQDESQASLDAGFDQNDQQMNEQQQDSDSIKENIESVIQQNNLNHIEQEYKIFTTEFDEIAKADILEDAKETTEIEKKFRSTTCWFPRPNNKTCK